MEGWKATCAGGSRCPVSDALYRDALNASVADPNGELFLAKDLLDGANGALSDREVGTKWLALAAEDGLATARKEIARRRKTGLVVETNDEKIAAAMQARRASPPISTRGSAGWRFWRAGVMSR